MNDGPGGLNRGEFIDRSFTIADARRSWAVSLIYSSALDAELAMDLGDSVVVLTHQAALAADYAFIVAVIALAIFCASVLYKARVAEQLRQTGEKHDNLQMRHFNPAQQVVVQRPEPNSEEAAEIRLLASRTAGGLSVSATPDARCRRPAAA